MVPRCFIFLGGGGVYICLRTYSYMLYIYMYTSIVVTMYLYTGTEANLLMMLAGITLNLGDGRRIMAHN